MCYEGQICDASASAERKTTQTRNFGKLVITIKSALTSSIEEGLGLCFKGQICDAPHLNRKPRRKCCIRVK